MLYNLKTIQEHISSKQYCDHPGKNSDSYHLKDLNIQDDVSISSAVSENGFAIFNIKNMPLLPIIRVLQKQFGKQLKDVGINKKYVAKIKASINGKYYINTAYSQPLHTDEGYRTEFPRFVSLVCVRPSLIGGTSTIVKTKELVDDLYRIFKDDISNLLRPDFIQIDTAYGKINKQILFNINKSTFGMSYSPIIHSIKTTELGHQIISSINKFIHNPQNQYRVLLKENDVLIMDNCQILHGRTAFKENDNRLFLRLWNGSLKL